MRNSDHCQQIVDLCRTLSARGYLAATGGNVAIRIDAACFAVTPSALAYDVMTAADVCIVRLKDLAREQGDLAPSVETGLHANVMRARPDVWCSIHTHQPVASACALIGRPLPVRRPDLRDVLGPEVPVVGYRPSGSTLLPSLLRRSLRPDVNAYLMRNHGVLCCGRDVASALAAVDALERLSLDVLARGMTESSAAGRTPPSVIQAVLSTLQVSR